MPRSFDESIPVWRENATGQGPRLSPVGSDVLPGSTHTCVIGAGISGLTTAYLLQSLGSDVVVLDAYGPGAGETGRTTAHLTAVLDDRFHELEKLFGAERARLAADSHRTAIDLIEAIVQDEAIDCDFERLDGFLVSAEPTTRELFDREA